MTYEDLKYELEARLADLEARLSNIKRDVTQAHSGDSAEQAQERENDEVVDAIGNETALSINIIQAALGRIENGTYGACDQCGESITQERLKAIPEATRCLNCVQ
jgi:DnaK suppressor protein